MVKKKEDGSFEVVPSWSILYDQMYNIKEKSPINSVWVGLSNYMPENEEEEAEITRLFEKYNCSPIFCDQKLVDEYTTYWEHVMKPLFYNFKGLYDDHDSENRQDNWQ